MDNLKSIFQEKNRALIFAVIGLFLIFFIALQAPTDPDFGWHLHNGSEIIKNRAIAHFDQDSFTMNDYPWICFSWISDIFIVLLQKLFGLFGLSMFFSIIAGTAFFLAARAFKSEVVYQVIIAMFGTILSVSTLGVRDQMWGILGLAVLIYILIRWRDNPQNKIIWYLPLLFAVWTNLHAGIIVGIGTMLLFFLIESWKKKTVSKNLILVFFLSILATFVNPYGPRMYQETWMTLIDFSGRFQLIEWRPLFFAGRDILLPAFIYAACLLVAQFYIKKRDLTLIIISALFFAFALAAWRNLPLFFIVSSPLAVMTLKDLIGKNLLDLIKMPAILLTFFILTFYIAWQDIKSVWAIDTDQKLLAQEADFPYYAVAFIRDKMPKAESYRLFNEYNWGGYILWQIPDQKVFIDGKMPHWKLPDRNIFADYLTFQQAQNLSDLALLIKKYDLNFALIRRNSPIVFKLSFFGWHNIYEDDMAIILKRP